MGIQRFLVDNVRDVRELGPRYLTRYLHWRRRRTYRAHIKGVGQVTMRARSADPAVFSQVFAQRQYELRHYQQFDAIAERARRIVERGKRPLILDLGANNGASALFFARMFPEAKVIAVEPDPGNAEVCRQNTAGHDVDVIAAAIGSARGNVQLNTAGFDTWGFVTTRSDDGQVPVITVNDLVEDHAHDAELFVVKIDIEGFEDDLFATNVEWVDEADVIIVEPHDWMLPDRHASHNFQRVLGRQSFDVMISGENLIYIRFDHPDRSVAASPATAARRPAS